MPNKMRSENVRSRRSASDAAGSEYSAVLRDIGECTRGGPFGSALFRFSSADGRHGLRTHRYSGSQARKRIRAFGEGQSLLPSLTSRLIAKVSTPRSTTSIVPDGTLRAILSLAPDPTSSPARGPSIKKSPRRGSTEAARVRQAEAICDNSQGHFFGPIANAGPGAGALKGDSAPAQVDQVIA
jgi:hypothetical protein